MLLVSLCEIAKAESGVLATPSYVRGSSGEFVAVIEIANELAAARFVFSCYADLHLEAAKRAAAQNLPAVNEALSDPACLSAAVVSPYCSPSATDKTLLSGPSVSGVLCSVAHRLLDGCEDSVQDSDFAPDFDDLDRFLRAMQSVDRHVPVDALPTTLPDSGSGAQHALEMLAPVVIGGAQSLGASDALAHMDPPTPWVTWVTALWNASLNQNLLHPDVAPVARDIEALVVNWISPSFGMDGGHMTPGSTVSNLTALWAARELRGIRRVVASKGAHLSVGKAAHLLGLEYLSIETDVLGAMNKNALPDDLSDAALVLTAGATSTGAIDPLSLCGQAAWTHVDAAWSGPLRFSARHGDLLDGIDAADSVAISAHKWMFQPKESALVLFRETETAHAAISFGGAYLSTPNVGVLGSHGASAVPLLATLLAWGRQGLADRIDRSMDVMAGLSAYLENDPHVDLFAPAQSGVLLWRPKHETSQDLRSRLPKGMSSLTEINGQSWVRQVAANPMADLKRITEAIDTTLSAGT